MGTIFIIQDTKSVAMSIKNAVAVQKLHDLGGIVEIAIVDQVPDRAIDVINELIRAYNRAGVTDKNIVGNKARNFLTDRVDTVASELDILEQEAEMFKKVE